ncbi:MAG: DMT family transporter [Alphaproteobacteria bacterium]
MSAPRPQNIRAAILWMGGALVCFVLMALSGRELSREISTFQIVFYRAAVGLALLLPYLLVVGFRQVRTARLPLHIVRNTIHFGGQCAWFYALALIPLAEVFAIEFTSPLWTAILAATFLGERVSPKRALAIFLGFVGVLIVIRPGMVEIRGATLWALAAAILYATNYTVTRAMTRTESALAIVFYMNVVQLPLSLAFAWPRWAELSPHLWVWAGVVGIVGVTAHFCIARAFAQAEATVVAPMDFLRLPFIALAGYLIYDEAIHPLVALGALVIIAGNWLNMRASHATVKIASR